MKSTYLWPRLSHNECKGSTGNTPASAVRLLTYPAVGSTTRSGIPVGAPWLTTGPSWSRMNTSSWQISVTKCRCSCRHGGREAWEADEARTQTAFQPFERREKRRLPEPCRCDRNDQLTWLWSRDRKNMFVELWPAFFYFRVYSKHELTFRVCES